MSFWNRKKRPDEMSAAVESEPRESQLALHESRERLARDTAHVIIPLAQVREKNNVTELVRKLMANRTEGGNGGPPHGSRPASTG